MNLNENKVLEFLENPQFNLRDLLLLTQLLFFKGMVNYQKLEKTSDQLIENIINEWKTHITVLMEQKTFEIQNKKDILIFYKHLLKTFEAQNTFELANAIYSLRCQELKKQIEFYKKEFKTILKKEC